MHSLRKKIRQQRNNVSYIERFWASKRLAQKILSNINFQKNSKVAIYISNDGEIDLSHVYKYLKNMGICIYLPVIAGKSLKFAKIGSHYRLNRFNIPEPVHTELLGAHRMNKILLPLVAFDKKKNRVGMGGGFYDRSLSFIKNREYFICPKLIGVGFDFQRVDDIKTNEWDIPLNKIFTPKNFYH